MPLYDYRCKECGHVVEMLEKVGSADERTCPRCGSRRMDKLISRFGVRASTPTSGGSCPTGTCPLS